MATVEKLRWGVLGVASIATRKVIPAMQRGERTEVVAIASRELARARQAADELGIARAYGSYEELLADPEIDVVYNPLPNHLHVPWSIRAAEAGKHVLCEKPIALSAGETRELIRARDRTGVVIGEAFMVRTHPQWLEARRLVAAGRIGELRLVSGHFSYFLDDPENVRNRVEWGGGALLDVGCYPVNLARFFYDQEPTRVMGLVDRDPAMKIDRLTSAMLDFPRGQAIFASGTQLVGHQRLELFGTTGRIEVEIPFNAPRDRPTRIVVDDGSDLFGGGRETIELPTADQYTVQGDEFSRAVQEGTPPPVPLEDAFRNMAVMDAILRSGETGAWEAPEAL
jgi:predicted dehydrogenase